MASLRKLKKDIDYLTEEVLADSFLTIYFNPDKEDKVIPIMEETVALRNELFVKANNPVEKKNVHLVRKHYAQLRREMFTGIDSLFEKLSAVSK